MFERSEAAQRHHRSGLLVEIEPSVDQRADPLGAGAIGNRPHQRREAFTELAVGLQLQIVEPVEVPEDRRHRHAGAFRDDVGRDGQLALPGEFEHGIDHRSSAALAPGVSPVDRRRAVRRVPHVTTTLNY